MSCKNPNNTNIPYYSFGQNPCSTGSDSCSVTVDSSCVVYTGPNLPAIGAESNDNLQDILDAINTALGTVSGIDWGSFDYSCLPGVITTAQQFAETISQYTCNVNSALEDFIENTYTPAIENIDANLGTISDPEFTSCSVVGVVDTDNYEQVLIKILSNLCSVNTQIDPSDANWNTYFSTDPLPDNITDAFNII